MSGRFRHGQLPGVDVKRPTLPFAHLQRNAIEAHRRGPQVRVGAPAIRAQAVNHPGGDQETRRGQQRKQTSHGLNPRKGFTCPSRSR